jgi:hypothetical protein
LLKGNYSNNNRLSGHLRELASAAKLDFHEYTDNLISKFVTFMSFSKITKNFNIQCQAKIKTVSL